MRMEQINSTIEAARDYRGALVSAWIRRAVATLMHDLHGSDPASKSSTTTNTPPGPRPRLMSHSSSR